MYGGMSKTNGGVLELAATEPIEPLTRRESVGTPTTLSELEATVTEPIEAQGTAPTSERAVASQQLLHVTGCGDKSSSGIAAAALWRRGKLAVSWLRRELRQSKGPTAATTARRREL